MASDSTTENQHYSDSITLNSVSGHGAIADPDVLLIASSASTRTISPRRAPISLHFQSRFTSYITTTNPTLYIYIPLFRHHAVDGSPMSTGQPSSPADKSHQNHYTSNSSESSSDYQDVNVQVPQVPEGNTMFRNWNDDDNDDDQRINTRSLVPTIVTNITSTNGIVNVNASHADFIVVNINTNRGTIYVDAGDTSIVIVNLVNNYGMVRTISSDASIIRLNINNTNDGMVVCTRD